MPPIPAQDDHVVRRVARPNPSRRLTSRSRATFRGFVPSQKPGNDFRLVTYESLLERDFIQLIEDDDSIVSYQDQPDPFIWRDGFNTHRHWPDFALVLRSGRRVCVAVTTRRTIARRGLASRFPLIAAGAISSRRFDAFQVWTDLEIREPARLVNANLRNAARGPHRDGPGDDGLIALVRALGGRATVGTIRTAAPDPGKATRAILRLMVRGDLVPERAGALFGDDLVLLHEARS